MQIQSEVTRARAHTHTHTHAHTHAHTPSTILSAAYSHTMASSEVNVMTQKTQVDRSQQRSHVFLNVFIARRTYSVKRGIAIVSRPSVRNVDVLWAYVELVRK